MNIEPPLEPSIVWACDCCGSWHSTNLDECPGEPDPDAYHDLMKAGDW